MTRSLSVSHLTVLKAVGILLIIFHNFCHLLPNCAVENEYTFSLLRVWDFCALISQGSHIVINIFSFLGHYGVPLFLFASGYGLASKYHSNTHVSFWDFLRYNVLKLWRLLLVAFLLWLVSDLYLHQWHWAHHGMDVLRLFTFSGNLFPKADLLVGPWWYFSVTMQLYIVFYWGFYHTKPVFSWAITSICVMLTIWAASMPQEDMLNYLRYNFVGNILPFAIGIYMARHGVCLSRKRNIFCALLWILSWFNAYLWVFSPTLFLLAILPVCSIEGTWRNLLLWLGGLSACLFVIHPIVRPYIIKGIKDGINPYIGLFLYTFITFIMSLAYQTMLKFIPKPRKTL